MRRNVVQYLPPEWLVDVTLKSGGGRDSRGNPLPTVSRVVKECLFAPRATSLQ